MRNSWTLSRHQCASSCNVLRCCFPCNPPRPSSLIARALALAKHPNLRNIKYDRPLIDGQGQARWQPGRCWTHLRPLFLFFPLLFSDDWLTLTGLVMFSRRPSSILMVALGGCAYCMPDTLPCMWRRVSMVNLLCRAVVFTGRNMLLWFKTCNGCYPICRWKIHML